MSLRVDIIGKLSDRWLDMTPLKRFFGHGPRAQLGIDCP
jgi:hypothetical protein